jgi:hypothetical protein
MIDWCAVRSEGRSAGNVNRFTTSSWVAVRDRPAKCCWPFLPSVSVSSTNCNSPSMVEKSCVMRKVGTAGSARAHDAIRP